jgi:hypothetical protein
MSAAAEVYISVDTPQKATREKIEVAIDQTLRGMGFDISADDRYNIGRYDSGIIVEAKSYSVPWEIFEKEWAEKLVRELHAIDEASDVELYVYNLDREADLSVLTRDLFSESYAEKAHA